jgi:hypothetical protein
MLTDLMKLRLFLRPYAQFLADLIIKNLFWIVLLIFGTLYLCEYINPPYNKNAKINLEDYKTNNKKDHTDLPKKVSMWMRIENALRFCLGNWIVDRAISTGDFVLNKPNPIV